MPKISLNQILPNISYYIDYHRAVRLFEVLVCLWIIFHGYKLLGVSSIIHSSLSFCPKVESHNVFGLDTILWQMGGDVYFIPSLLAQGFISIWIIIHGSSFITRSALWFLTVNVFSFCGSIGDGGTSLLCTLLFLFIFCDHRSWGRPNQLPIRHFFNALVLFSLQWQVAIVYLQAALSKIRSDGWSSGVALHYILQLPEFSNPVFAKMITSYDFLIVFFTYATIFFQLSFAFVMLLPNMRIIWLILGIFFHIGIALCMGLFSFGLFMICIYALFLSNKHIDWLYEHIYAINKIKYRLSKT